MNQKHEHSHLMTEWLMWRKQVHDILWMPLGMPWELPWIRQNILCPFSHGLQAGCPTESSAIWSMTEKYSFGKRRGLLDKGISMHSNGISSGRGISKWRDITRCSPKMDILPHCLKTGIEKRHRYLSSWKINPSIHNLMRLQSAGLSVD